MSNSNKIILEEDIINCHDYQIPNLANDLSTARALLQHCNESGDCLYDHLAEIINKVLTEQPDNVMNNFEEYSSRVRENRRFKYEEMQFNEVFVEPNALEDALSTVDILKSAQAARNTSEEENKVLSEKIDGRCFYANLPFYKLIGICFPWDDAFYLSLSIEKFIRNSSNRTCRFWGKFFALKQSYWVLEVQELDANTLESSEAKINDNEQRKSAVSEVSNSEARSESKNDMNTNRNHKPPIPQSQYVQAKETPDEKLGSGTNRFIYYVSNEAKGPWIQLPLVTPKQIVQSRKIKKVLTGHLDAPVNSFPCFLGTEKDLLRAIIARITHGTYVAPINSWTTKKPRTKNYDDEEEEEEEEEEIEEEEGVEVDNDKPVYRDPKYKPISPKDLLDATFWSHFLPFIQKNGRVTKTPKESSDGDDDDGAEENEEAIEEEEEEKEDEGNEEEENEYVPPLFSLCSEDISNGNCAAWSARITHDPNPNHCVTAMKSNIWPGAYAIASGHVTEVVYFGWGMKSGIYTTPMPPKMQDEYPTGPEILEINDPTPGEEEDFMMKNEPSIANETDKEDELDATTEGSPEEST